MEQRGEQKFDNQYILIGRKWSRKTTDEGEWPDPSLPHVDVARRSQRIAIVVSASLEHATLSTATLNACA